MGLVGEPRSSPSPDLIAAQTYGSPKGPQVSSTGAPPKWVANDRKVRPSQGCPHAIRHMHHQDILEAGFHSQECSVPLLPSPCMHVCRCCVSLASTRSPSPSPPSRITACAR